ncbi:SDR family NAD(P)-dependent oxidoreductase [Paenibacillus sp. NPDC057934]|uniref:SDR family NAD(P)-dependent oxidoreductase n=1 Tax=Paenibacillus sp. NPDC057934 TaxID=3346282 RepID=UPI0036DBC2F5
MDPIEQLDLMRKPLEVLNSLLLQLLRGQLQSMGLTLQGLKAKPEEHCDLPGMLDKYRKWLVESVNLLSDLPSVEALEPASDMEALWREWDKRMGEWAADPNLRAHAALADVMIRALPEILTGKKPATDLMFPDGGMQRVEGVYKNNLIADYFNTVLVEAALAWVKERVHDDPHVNLRILEVGAGTGGTTGALLPALKPYAHAISEYCYTDISKAFLIHGEKKYGPRYSFLTCHLLNIEEPLASQGIQVGQYDAVIATNVLHATQNMRQTIRNTKALLKRDGRLFINEITGKSVFTHLTFGLLEGWWSYEDAPLRIPGCPSLSSGTWQTLLENEGIHSIRFHAHKAHFLGQQIVEAVSDGVIRQQRKRNKYVPVSGKQEKAVRYKGKHSTQPEITVNEEALRQRSQEYFIEMLSRTLKVPPGQIEANRPLADYGLDSILNIQVTNQLRTLWDDIGSTLFFQYPTVEKLTQYFLDSRKESLAEVIGMKHSPVKLSEGEEIEAEERLSTERSASPKGSFTSRSRFKEMSPPTLDPTTIPFGSKDIAIIGLTGRYAQAQNLKEFWNHLKNGQNCITEIPEDRWQWQDYYRAEGQERNIYTKWGGFIKDIDKFDPLFFRISPREAEKMDPQERLFLETAYACIEDAGYTPQSLCKDGKVGVFVGIMNGNYPTGAAYWSVANRLSYVLNFQGPSMAVDTACSSSLTAVHLAVESLNNGTSECAIVGGVNLIVDPEHYLRLSELKMLSPGPQCKSFGDNADGFVDGEGVGAVILKPLQKAIADGDQIYGVIKGTMLNGGGKTNGYTVPNPEAQSRLITETLQRAGIHARSISYVEAHGTGTALGDPIEIEGLRQAFGKDTQDTDFCSIGSVKSNIGHCESAAGIAGLTKILLQLKHRQLVPSLHSNSLNPNIDFKKTPFRVQQELSEWKQPFVAIEGSRQEHPRRAGISSFGAGGANAHVLIEEYVQPEEPMAHHTAYQKPVMVVLSARNEERLAERVQQLISDIEEQQYLDRDIEAIAYTLQVGREPMEERLGFVVESLQELEIKLRSFLLEGVTPSLYRGQVKHNKETMLLFDRDEDMIETIDQWFQKAKFEKLLQLWVKGLDLDWNRLYTERHRKPRRISLPTYPFARERYWATKGENKAPNSLAWLHPLLQRNISVLQEQRFTSVFTGEEFFLKDHKVFGRKILPGMAYLEMARKAVEQSVDGYESKVTMKLQHVVWMSPLWVDQHPVQVNIRLMPEGTDRIQFEIYSTEIEDERVVHSQGVASFSNGTGTSRLDLATIHSRCDRGMVTAEECYEFFQSIGLEYGDTFQGIKTLYLGQDEVFAELSLSCNGADIQRSYMLHPSIMDSALQASIVLMAGSSDQDESVQLQLPYAIQEVEVMAACSSQMWAWVRYSEGFRDEGKALKLDIDLCNDEGHVCVSLRGFSTRRAAMSGSSAQASFPSEESSLTLAMESVFKDPLPVETLLLNPVWESMSMQSMPLAPPNGQMVVIGGKAERRHQVQSQYPLSRILDLSSISTTDEIIDSLEACGPIDHIVWISPEHVSRSVSDSALIDEQNDGVVLAFRLIKSLLSLGYGTKDLRWTVITVQAQSIHKYDEINPTHASLHGLIGSMAKEYLHWDVCMADLDANAPWPVRELLHLTADPNCHPYVYRDGQWHRQELVPLQAISHGVSGYKSGGVYIVIGGAGGIGRAWSEYMIRTYGAQVVWIGRREMNADIKIQIEQLSKLGPAPLYIAADASDPLDLQRAYDEIKRHYHKIHGVIHSAIVLSDKSLAYMEESQFKAALKAKIDTSVSLAQVFQQEPLDFVMFFSSLNAFTKAPGQSNYVAGCTFKDAFAHQLSLEWTCKVKVINWGYWGSVGVVASASYQKQMDRIGIRSIEPEEAMETLEVLLSGPINQLALMKTVAPLEIQGVNWDKSIVCYCES